MLVIWQKGTPEPRKPGVVLVTSGPGATNVITPIQDALSDGVPLIVFCGQVPTSAIGSDAFQEADIIGITRGEMSPLLTLFLLVALLFGFFSVRFQRNLYLCITTLTCYIKSLYKAEHNGQECG